MPSNITFNVLFAIRDDDIDYWTDVNQLEEIYAPLWGKGIVTSFAVIPFSIETHNRGDWDTFYQMENTKRPIGDNVQLVDYLRKKLAEGKIEIMLHGYNHLYMVRESPHTAQYIANKDNLDALRAKKRGMDLQWIPECVWKSEQQLRQELQKGKNYLESLLGAPIKVFVPPSNTIGAAGARALDTLQMNLSGIIGRNKDRDWSYDYVRAYLKRLIFFLRYHGAVYPFSIRIWSHREIAAHSLTPIVTFESLKSQFDLCRAIGAPFVLATHYWELAQHQPLQKMFYQIIDYALHGGAYPVPISNLYEI